ncbi:glycosyltransferase family 1 protein [Flavobacterium sp. 20NA77.7]|uniref:Glycosyltransferase family 1 protein n=1 Tax=Flavobacterium nakdongensis TaxID=3073563 RepID=A0ABY9REJ7_9FLAO|nr:glycosyltransferase family 1 protein [Flavobacterium sp. 20NA77.7]WMW78566.1 glycosyltransferase family 1 protein [Flavobacterium sp. 20NA77.7]
MNIGFEAKRVFHNKTGLGNYSRDLIRILAKFYPENNYFLYNPKEASQTLFVSQSTNCIEKLPRTSFYQKFYNLWRQRGIIADLKKDNTRLFHGLSGELPSGLKENGIKSVVTIHDLIFLRYPHLYSFFDRKIHYYKFKKAAKQADVIIAISEQTKIDIINFLGVDASKIKVIYQGCHAAFKEIYSTDQRNEVVKKYQLPEKFILNVGTLEERKNALTLVKAIKDLDTQLVLVGKETSYSSQIHHFIKQHHLAERVHFLKGLTIQELAIVYQCASVFVYPSIFEGFGIPILEALYSKVPVITNKYGVFPEAAGPNSCYIEPFDVSDLHAKIKLILLDTSLANEMKEKGFEFAQKFNDDAIAQKLMTVYNDLL